MKSLFFQISVLCLGAGAYAYAQGPVASLPDAPVPVQTQPAPATPAHSVAADLRHALDDSSVLVRVYHRDGAPPSFEPNRGIYIIDLRFGLPLSQSGQLSLRGRVGTGGTATDDTTILAQPVQPYFKTTLNLREIYLQDHLTPNFNLQVGALELLQPGVARTGLSDSQIGWVDGARADLRFKSSVENVDVTVGHLGLYTVTSAPSRFKNEDPTPNFMQARVKVAVNAFNDLTVEQSRLSGQALSRVMLETAVQKSVKFVDTVVLEEMVGSGDDLQKGFAVGLRKRFHSTEFLPTYVMKDKSIDPTPDKPFVPLDSNYYPGNQFLLVTNHYVTPHNRFQVRVYKFFEPYVSTAANHGWLADVSYKYTFWKR